MPISYTYNTVFIHIPKCAGTSVEKILGTSSGIEYFSTIKRNINGTSKSPQHFTYLELKSSLDIDWSLYYLFSVVRNPYARFVSGFKYRKQLYLSTGRQDCNPIDFSTYVTNLTTEKVQRINKFDTHLETQSSFLKNESNQLEPSIEIFKFENLEPCWTKLKEKTGVEFKNVFWSRKSKDDKPYNEFYTQETADIIYNFYKEDFDNFGYSRQLW